MTLATTLNQARINYSRFMTPKVIKLAETISEKASQTAQESRNEFAKAFLQGFAEGTSQGAQVAVEKNELNCKLYEKYLNSYLADFYASRDLIMTYGRFLKNAKKGTEPNETMLDWIQAAVAYPEEIPEMEVKSEIEQMMDRIFEGVPRA